MDDNGGPPNIPNAYRPKETFQRAQETQVEHRFPKSTGIVPVPRGSKGPRSLYLRRHGDSFGFTLRHFIVYPPDSIAEKYDGRHAAVGALLAPMETIFVKQVKERGPARQAGLQRGDRLIAVNGIPVKDHTYSQVVQFIVNSPEYLHLLVVPKEDDVLQKFFSETAYNPASNQPTYSDIPCDRQSAQQIISRRLAHPTPEFQVDAISWRSLQQPYPQTDFVGLQATAFDRGQRSADNLLYSEPRHRHNQQEIYAEIHPHDIGQRGKCRAAPQVPLYKKMGRRASEGNILSDRCESSNYSSLNPETSDDHAMKAMYKNNYLPEGPEISGLNYPNTAGCRLSLEVGRRESNSSLSSSIADGSKDSFGSFDSNSTLTGHETDDSAIMNRFRKSVQQKEEFLKNTINPSSSAEQALVRREFYSRPKKLEKQMWPPNDRESPSRTTKPNHQNFARVKNDIDNERDFSPNQNGHEMQGGGAAFSVPQQRGATSPRERENLNLDRIYEGATAPTGYDSMEAINGSVVGDPYEDRRIFSPPLQMVYKRAKDFESGRPLPEDDPVPGNRMNFSKSELARLSSKKLVPNVTERAHEYETRAVTEPRRDTSLTSTTSSSSVLKRIHYFKLYITFIENYPPLIVNSIKGKYLQRQLFKQQLDEKEPDSALHTDIGWLNRRSNVSSVSVNEILSGSRGLSGNVTVSSGSKYLHCPLPAEWQTGGRPTDKSGNEATKVRARSNSAESWVAALGSERNREGSKRISRQDASATSDRNKAKGQLNPFMV
nr:uncharacterized protein LOC111509223 [Leptinotarsa decemlineata]